MASKLLRIRCCIWPEAKVVYLAKRLVNSVTAASKLAAATIRLIEPICRA